MMMVPCNIKEGMKQYSTSDTSEKSGESDCLLISGHGALHIHKSREQYDACCDQTFPPSLLSNKLVWDMCLNLE
jgi:hypothetical protein